MSFKLADLDVIKTLATQRDDLVRVSRGLDKARTFRVVMGTNESGELSCSLPATFANDVLGSIMSNGQVKPAVASAAKAAPAKASALASPGRSPRACRRRSSRRSRQAAD